MADYTEDIKSVYNDIKDNGGSVRIVRPTITSYSPVTTSAVTTTTGYDTYGLYKSYSDKFIDGTIIKKGDVKLLVPSYGLTITLENTDKIHESGNVWNIIHIDKVAPSNVVILYKLQLRK